LATTSFGVGASSERLSCSMISIFFSTAEVLQ
jgi:hypothetical protein